MDIKNNFFTLNNITYVIIYSDFKMEILKNVDNQLIPLSNDERNNINNIIDDNTGYQYDSERLDAIIRNNNRLENINYLQNYLHWLESIIPQNCRDNFYRNLETLDIDYNLDVINNEMNSVERLQDYNRSGGYDTKTNRIDIDPKAIQEVWRIAQITKNPQEFFWNEYSHTLLHELAHMASTKYDEKSQLVLCGFDKCPIDNFGEKNRGLTEGMTELIASIGVPGQTEYASNYYIEECFINQLSQIIGSDIILQSYFSNKGTKELEQGLNEIGYDRDKAFELFRNMENNYRIRHINEKQNLLGNIQLSLVDYLDAWCNIEVNRPNFDRGNFENMLNTYSQMLITPEKLQLMQKNPENYEGLLESIQRFNSIRDKYMNVLQRERSSQVENFTETKTKLEQLQQQTYHQEYQQYRESMRNVYLEERDSDTVIRSQFTVRDGEKPQCDHRLERVSQEGTTVLQSQSFDYNDEFKQQMLEPSIMDYAQCSPILSSDITTHASEMVAESQNVNFIAMSENNNVLSINNIEPEYANNISNAIQQIEPVSYEQQMSQQTAMQREMAESQLSMSIGSMGGFSNILILSLLVVLICTLFVILRLYLSG